ncbi:MAG: hypothetical protein IPM29_05035 [Planctomycetes bacterium]|nr:hypothetical protein [Planctomycetota bacterium]
MTHDEKLLKLYELAQQEEHFYIEGQAKRLGFYSGLLTAILGASVFKLFDCDHYVEVFALTIGPVFAVAVSVLGIRSAGRYYRRLMEVITKLAKLDQRLGLTTQAYGGSDPDEGYWPGEALIPSTQVDSRRKSATATAFVERTKTGGDYVNTKVFFVIAIIVSSALAVGLVGLGILVACGTVNISGG